MLKSVKNNNLMDGIIYRPIKTNETAFLREMLWEAIFLLEETKPTLTKTLLDHPDIRACTCITERDLK